MGRICGIYLIKNKKDGKTYVGLSVNIKHRIAVHLSALRKGYEENGYLQNAWNKYKEENFEFSIIEECNKESLIKREIYWIKKLKSMRPNGYNISSGGNVPPSNKGTKFTEEHRQKISEKLMGNNNGKFTKGVKRKNSTCKYLGVTRYKEKENERFLYRFNVVGSNGKMISRSGFITEVDAAIGRDFIMWKEFKNMDLILFKENVINNVYVGKYERTSFADKFHPLID